MFQMLSSLDLDTPVHRLRVERSTTASTASKPGNAEASDDEETVDVLGANDDIMDDVMVMDEHHLSPGPGIDRSHQVPLSKFYMNTSTVRVA